MEAEVQVKKKLLFSLFGWAVDKDLVKFFFSFKISPHRALKVLSHLVGHNQVAQEEKDLKTVYQTNCTVL